ncbi:hypothetical protein GCM10020221_02530 [Streptomyces thioluteus]|uniref:Uncharacterized protein n=1 Tax=Streptomyces thioluteus TaxID=66431 RepID=A0ABN3WCC9_STRTU
MSGTARSVLLDLLQAAAADRGPAGAEVGGRDVFTVEPDRAVLVNQPTVRGGVGADEGVLPAVALQFDEGGGVAGVVGAGRRGRRRAR